MKDVGDAMDQTNATNITISTIQNRGIHYDTTVETKENQEEEIQGLKAILDVTSPLISKRNRKNQSGWTA